MGSQGAEWLRLRVAARGLPYRLRLHSRVVSTQDLVARAARNSTSEGLVVIADEQTAGRGRLGRSWVAPAGTSVMFSVLWRPTAPDPTLALAAGLAVAEGIEAATGLTISLKWPNDCLVGGRKVAGLLVETVGVPGGPSAGVAVGVGCNVAWAGIPKAERPGPNATALDLEGWDGMPAKLLLELLERLEARYRQWLATGFEGLLDHWVQRLSWMGREVELHLPDRVVQGRLLGVRTDGRLQLEVGDQVMLVAAGDLGGSGGGSLRLRDWHLDDPGPAI